MYNGSSWRMFVLLMLIIFFFVQCIVYIPPENSKYSSPDCFLEIEQELLTVSKNCNNICLVGDYNARLVIYVIL